MSESKGKRMNNQKRRRKISEFEKKINKWTKALAESYGEYYDLDETFKGMYNYEVTKEFLTMIGLALLKVSGKSFADLNKAIQGAIDGSYGIWKPEYSEPNAPKLISADSPKYLNDIEETAEGLTEDLELWRVIVEPNTEPSDTVAQGARGAPSCKCGPKKRT